jgi:hypothetical protein
MRVRIGITAVTLAVVTPCLVAASGALAASHHRAGRAARAVRATGPAPNVSATALSSWQTNGLVRRLAYASGFVYAGGTFTGEMAPGSKTVSASQALLARFNSATGAFDSSFNPVFTNAVTSKPSVNAVKVAGSILYVGGSFTSVAMGAGPPQARGYGAAFDLSTSPPTLLAWNPKANGAIDAIAVSHDGTNVYLGGAFSTLNAISRSFLGEVDAATGLVPTSWAPAVDHPVVTMAVAPLGDKVVIGGFFTMLNGSAQQGAGAVDATTGASVTWPNILPSSSTVNSQATDVDLPVSTVSTAHPDGIAYVSVQGVGRGNFDGTYAADVATGTELWENDCFGDAQATLLLGGWLYKASHASDCNYAPAGFPPVIQGNEAKFAHHLTTMGPADGSIGFWNPNTNGGPSPGDLGPYSFATNGSSLFVGGVFSLVNGKQQEGLAIFPAKPSGKKDGSAPAAPAAPAAVSTSRGVDSVSVPAVSDHDNGLLTYNFYRNGRFAGARTRVSWPWALPLVHFRDSGRKPGRTFFYTVRVCDPSGSCSPFSPRSKKVTVASKNPTGYIKRVLASKPSFLWELSETSGNTAFDAAKHGYRGTYEPGTTKGVKPGPIGGSTAPATGFAGGLTSGGMVTAQKAITSPSTFSIELWFRTSTIVGGELAGFSSVQTGTGGTFDRQIWMTNDGHLAFAVHGTGQVILSSLAYNDNTWHHVVATFNTTSGMALYVDGLRVGTNPGHVHSVYSGFWRVGGGDLTGWSLDVEPNVRPPTAPNNFFITGDIADVAVYPTALTAKQVAQHWAANYLSH